MWSWGQNVIWELVRNAHAGVPFQMYGSEPRGGGWGEVGPGNLHFDQPSGEFRCLLCMRMRFGLSLGLAFGLSLEPLKGP